MKFHLSIKKKNKRVVSSKSSFFCKQIVDSLQCIYLFGGGLRILGEWNWFSDHHMHWASVGERRSAVDENRLSLLAANSPSTCFGVVVGHI